MITLGLLLVMVAGNKVGNWELVVEDLCLAELKGVYILAQCYIVYVALSEDAKFRFIVLGLRSDKTTKMLMGHARSPYSFFIDQVGIALPSCSMASFS